MDGGGTSDVVGVKKCCLVKMLNTNVVGFLNLVLIELVSLELFILRLCGRPHEAQFPHKRKIH